MNREDDGHAARSDQLPQTTPLDETTTLLIRARNFIQRGWCRAAIARDADGNHLMDARSADAVAWCSIGALEATGSNVLTRHSSQLYDGSKSQWAPNASLDSMTIR